MPDPHEMVELTAGGLGEKNFADATSTDVMLLQERCVEQLRHLHLLKCYGGYIDCSASILIKYVALLHGHVHHTIT